MYILHCILFVMYTLHICHVFYIHLHIMHVPISIVVIYTCVQYHILHHTVLYHSECDKALLCIRAIEALTCDPDNPSLQKSTPKQCTWLTPEFQHSLVTSTFCIHGKDIYILWHYMFKICKIYMTCHVHYTCNVCIICVSIY